jgi:hypothetical protein
VCWWHIIKDLLVTSPAALNHVTGAVDAQVSGVAVATAGFVLATRWFQVPHNEVQYGHGKLGMAIVVIVYLQVSCDKWDQVPHDVHLIAS